jgi:F0F1-type ATP synthase delta subunit
MKQIKKLAKASYTGESLDNQKVLAVARHLSKKELREYIKALRLIEDKNTVTITVPDKKTASQMVNNVKNRFKGKKIEISEDKSLIAGARILDFDTIYEYDLKSKIDDIANSLSK